MRSMTLDRLVLGTALALILSVSAAPAQTAPDAAPVEAQAPSPKPNAETPADATETPAPASIADKVDGEPTKAAATQLQGEAAKAEVNVNSLVPMPSLTDDLPPPSAADVAATQSAPTAPIAEAAPLPKAPTVVAAPAPALSATPPATPAVSVADQELTQELRSFVGSRGFDRLVRNRQERAAIEAFYKARDYAPIWIGNGVATERAKVAMARLKGADALGLSSADYKTPDLAAATADARAEAEIQFGSVVLDFARHAQSGRSDPSRISSNIEYKLPMPDPANVLARLASDDIGAVFDSFEPPHEGYRALKAKLAELRAAADEAKTPRIAGGRVLKIGKKPVKDERVPMLRERLGLPAADGEVYDAKLAAAVKEFQASANLQANGHLNAVTIDALNGVSKAQQVDAIVASMERWRWLPRDLGEIYAMVNIPDFSLRVARDGKVVWKTRIVVGKPSTPTPIFSAQLENILVNPTWHVPDSIVYNEYLPATKNDPGVLARMGLRVEHNRDGTVSITQPPGPGNALGRIKFNFSNKFNVYLHDTPDKKLFAHDRRSYSHGCMRVQNPDQFGEVLASYALEGQGYTAAKLTSMYGKGETWLNFKRKIPVHITYMTAYVDDDGKLVVRDDIYGLDARVRAGLKGEDRDFGQQDVVARITRTAPKRVAVQREPAPVENFFSRLFR